MSAMTYQQVWATARDLAEKELGHAIDDEYVTALVSATITALGFHVNTRTNEVCDPRPQPAAYPAQTGPSYSRFSRGRKK